LAVVLSGWATVRFDAALIAADPVVPIPADLLTATLDPGQSSEDVTDRVEVQLTSSLRPAKGELLSSGVTVRNTSDAEIPGCLVVLVDDAGHGQISFAENDGLLATGERFVQVLPLNGKLKAAAKTTAKRIEFTAAAELSQDERNAVTPKFRVLRLDFDPLAKGLNTPLAKEENLPGKNYTQSRLEQVMAIQNRHTAELMRHEGVFGTATGEDDNGNPVLLVYTQRHGIAKNLPGQFEGVPVEQQVTGSVFRAGPAWARAQQGKAADTLLGTTAIPTDPTARQTRPVPIGVSLFNLPDVCASGTLGCRVVFPDGTLGILTNSHVGSREGVAAAVVENLSTGVAGDLWTQPGCGDTPAGTDIPNDVIASLVDFQTFTLAGINHIDAAIGRIRAPNNSLTPADQIVMACTPADGYGFPSSKVVPPTIGMRVLKYGRTTGLRKGKIRGLNANVTVAYSRGLIFFVNQIDVYGDDIGFGMPGDSGSLVVTAQGHNPVGLLFGGSGFEVLCNPMQTVVERFNIAIDDGTATPPTVGPGGPSRSPGSNRTGRMGGAGGRVVIP
jgi:hypothetical protein